MQKSVLAEACLSITEPASNYINRRAGLERTGNWCHHDPVTPRFFEKPEEHKARPKILTWAMDAWSRFYTSPGTYFKEIRLYRESQRQQRSESREAVASVAQVLLHYTELASLRVGVPHITNGFRSLTIEFLATKAEIGVKRASRAIKVLKRAGYLKMIERFDTKEGEPGMAPQFIGLAAVKSLTPGFFKACGINLQWLSAQRRLARKRINKRFSNHIRDLQESSATIIDISRLVAEQGNSRAHIALMKSLLKSDENKQEKQREKERARRRSLARATDDSPTF